MRKKISFILILIIIMLVSGFACKSDISLPFSGGQEEANNLEPDLTLTALFAPPINIATGTIPPPVVFTQTMKPDDITASTISPSVSSTATITQTATISATPTRTSTAVWSPCYRSGPKFDATYITPSIDGVWDEWGTTQYPASYVVYGVDSWVNADDLGASFRVGWDKQNLYIAVKVGDEKYVQNASGQNIYQGDSIEILIDANLCGDYYDTNIDSGDDYQLGISPGNPNVDGAKEAFMWYPRSAAGGRSISIGSVQQDGVYRVEAAIPWSNFGISPWAGQTFGFALSVSDNDDTNQNVQESMVSSVSTRRLTNPTTWGTLILK